MRIPTIVLVSIALAGCAAEAPQPEASTTEAAEAEADGSTPALAAAAVDEPADEPDPIMAEAVVTPPTVLEDTCPGSMICVGRLWRARDTVAVWGGRERAGRPVDVLLPGECFVMAETSVVVDQPGVAVMKRAYSDELAVGDTVHALHYVGEGYFAVSTPDGATMMDGVWPRTPGENDWAVTRSTLTFTWWTRMEATEARADERWIGSTYDYSRDNPFPMVLDNVVDPSTCPTVRSP